ncbi:uncharacterized protein EAE97_007207 [Botrytis byssoidea]|uniref:Telomere replication protein EST3 n=1 Tax=Botrytis byssoidea TaxID=139641 RepID=A0A9P5IIW0_9HELO|nr:uncharacterized protein EAE97_007207 [Botrytis byssoidea]KAF7939126.1 hypothetical protein EAE97_007207 [Botrytis byssoidea]
MTLLRSWLAQNIEQSLKEALIWLKLTRVEHENASKSHEQFSYEQERLFIKLEKPGLIHLISNSKAKDSTQSMIVSDGTTKITAIFQQDFLDRYLEKHKWTLEEFIGETLAAEKLQLPPIRLYLEIPRFKPKGPQDVSGSARAVDIGEIIDNKLDAIKEFLDVENRGYTVQQNFDLESQNTSTPSQSAMLATQDPASISESRREKSILSDLHRPKLCASNNDLLAILQKPTAIQITADSPHVGESGQPLDSADVSGSAQPLSPKSSLVSTNLERGDETRHINNLQVQQTSTPSIDEQRTGNNMMLRDGRPNANNATLEAMESSSGKFHNNSLINEPLQLQKSLPCIPHPYGRISREQNDWCKRPDSIVSIPDDHRSAPNLPPAILKSQLAFYEELLAARVSATPNNVVQSSQASKADSSQVTIETEDRDHCKDSPAALHRSKGTEELEYSPEDPQSKTVFDSDEGHQSDSDSSDMTEVSCPSPERNSRPRQAMEENHTSHQSLNRDRTHSPITYGEDEDPDSTESKLSDAMEVSCPSSEHSSKPRQVVGQDDNVEQVAGPENSPTFESGDGTHSSDSSDVPLSEACQEAIPQSSPNVTESKVTCVIKDKASTVSVQYPANSVSDDEELELDIPHVLGDEIQGENSPVSADAVNGIQSRKSPEDDHPRFPQRQLETAQRKSEVQVEKTPNHNKRANAELTSDSVIPGTYDSPQNEAVEDSLLIPESGRFQLLQLPKVTPQVFDTIGETPRDKKEPKSSKVQQSREQQISSKSNDHIVYPTIPRTLYCQSMPIPNLDGATSEALHSPSASPSISFLPLSRSSPEQGHDGERPFKRQKITDPLALQQALGFSQEETPCKDRNEMVRANRREIREVLQRRSPTVDPGLMGNNTEGTKIVAFPEDSQTSHHGFETDLHDTVISDQTSTSYQNLPLGQSSPPLGGRNMTRASIVSERTRLSSGHAHQSKQRPTSLFEKYSNTYPRYKGNKKQFICALVYLEWLGTPTRQPRKSLWDDFVWFYTLYMDHVLNSRNRLSGIRFYNELGISDPYFTHFDKTTGPIITTESLNAALSPESPDYSIIEDLREKYGSTTSQPLISPGSIRADSVRQQSSEFISFANADTPLPSRASTHLENLASRKSSRSSDRSPSSGNTELTPTRQKKKRTYSETTILRNRTPEDFLLPSKESKSQSTSSKQPVTYAALSRASKEPRKAPGRFFETPSQLLFSSDMGSSPHNSSSPLRNLASPRSLRKTSDGPSSVQINARELASPVQREAPRAVREMGFSRERRPQERISKSSRERSISPPPPREIGKCTPASNKPEKVDTGLENQEQQTSLEKPTKFPSTASTFIGKWEFGKYLAQRRRETGVRRLRSTPRTSFGMKPRSSGENKG